MKSIKPALTALGLAAMAYAAPMKANSDFQLNAMESEWSNAGYVEGAAITSGSKLGLGIDSIRTYADDLSGYSKMTTPVTNIDDAGSYDANHILVHNGGSGIYKVDLATGFADSTSSVNGTGVEGISSAFSHNGKIHFAAIDSLDDTVKFFEWGNADPVAIGPNVGSDYTGLEIIANGPVADLNQIPILVSRNYTGGGANLDQYFNGALAESHHLGGSDLITDIAYDSDSGVLTTSLKGGRSGGGMANYDFASHVVPEPGTMGLMGLGALGLIAARKLRL